MCWKAHIKMLPKQSDNNAFTVFHPFDPEKNESHVNLHTWKRFTS